MNERIKDLMQEAGTDTSGKWMGVEHAAKFAELIVRECIDIADEYDGVGSTIVGRIEKHFGVEE